MLKKLLLLGIVSGVLAGVAGIIYQKVYIETVGEGFVNIAKSYNIIGACVLGGIIAAIGYFLLNKVLKSNTEAVFNLLFAVLSFASLLYPVAFKLPLDQESPELFPGLTVPMHFFPALAWFALKPLFAKSV
jgi:ABC-type branched-subunit amino acid transport system permease subunit